MPRDTFTPGPVDSPFRVRFGDTREPVYFRTITAAATRRSIEVERFPRAVPPVVEYRDPDDMGDPDAWHPIEAAIGGHAVPDHRPPVAKLHRRVT